MRWCLSMFTVLLLGGATQAEHSLCYSPEAELCAPTCDSGCCDPGDSCCGSCLSGCGFGSGHWLDDVLGGKSCGLLKPSDHCFDDFISPMTNPVFFEDPRTLTEARFIFINHSVPGNLFGNEAQLYALQMRAALTENLSLIATKDGFIVSENPLVGDGWADGGSRFKIQYLQRCAVTNYFECGCSLRNACRNSSRSARKWLW